MEDMEDIPYIEPLSSINIATPLPDSNMGADEAACWGAEGSYREAAQGLGGTGGGSTGGGGTGALAALDLAGRSSVSQLRTHSAQDAGSSGGSSAGGGSGASAGVFAHVRSASALPAAVTGSSGGGLPNPRLVEGAMDLPGAGRPGSVSAPASAPKSGGGARGAPAPSPLATLQGGGAGAAAASAAGLASRVGDWRLAVALSGAPPFVSLVLELSRLTACCYAKAGRVRSSALVYADVATMLLQSGKLEEACRWVGSCLEVCQAASSPLALGRVFPCYLVLFIPMLC